MKKTLIIIGSIIFIILLGINGVRMQIRQSESEVDSYISNLGFQFSATIDSVRPAARNFGIVIFHITDGAIDSVRENEIGKSLKHHDKIRFLRYKTTSVVKMLSHELNLYKPGDSIQVDTDKNLIRIFRDGKVSKESTVKNSMRGI